MLAKLLSFDHFVAFTGILTDYSSETIKLYYFPGHCWLILFSSFNLRD